VSHHILLCNDTECVHCEHGQCTCWKVELVVAQGTRLLYCNTYTPVYHKSDRLLVDDPLEGWY